jgi:hypothetical protein
MQVMIPMRMKSSHPGCPRRIRFPQVTQCLNFGFGADSLKARHQAAPAMKPMNFDAISWLRIDGY